MGVALLCVDRSTPSFPTRSSHTCSIHHIIISRVLSLRASYTLHPPFSVTTLTHILSLDDSNPGATGERHSRLWRARHAPTPLQGPPPGTFRFVASCLQRRTCIASMCQMMKTHIRVRREGAGPVLCRPAAMRMRRGGAPFPIDPVGKSQITFKINNLDDTPQRSHGVLVGIGLTTDPGIQTKTHMHIMDRLRHRGAGEIREDGSVWFVV